MNHIKVVFLGDAISGKSTLVARLMKDGAQVQETLNSPTQCLSIQEKTVAADGLEYRLHLWDFGGPEIQHELHRMILTKRTVYVVVLNARDGNMTSQARQWLQSIHHHVGDEPVILVANRHERGLSLAVDEKSLGREFSNLAGIVQLSSSFDGTQEFRRKFTDVLMAQVGYVFLRNQPAHPSWNSLPELLQECNCDHISMTQFHKLCNQAGISDSVTDRRKLVDWLCSLGIALHFTGNGRLEEYLILRPTWVLDAALAILLRYAGSTMNGRLPHDILVKTLGRTGAEVDYLLNLLRKFHLSFQSDDRTEFIPMLCDPNAARFIQTSYEENPAVQALLLYYDYLPFRVIHRLMVERSRELDLKLVWQTGGMFRWQEVGCSAVVKADGDILRIMVHPGKNSVRPQLYMDALKEHLDRINLEMGLTVLRAEVVYKQDGQVDTFDLDALKSMHESGQTMVYSRSLRRMIPISNILGKIDSPMNQHRETLLKDMTEAFLHMQRQSTYGRNSEKDHTYLLRQYILEKGYAVSGESNGAIRGFMSKNTALDLEIRMEPDQPWTACALFQITDRSGVRNFNDHLEKLLSNRSVRELPFLFLICYANCDASEYHSLWRIYNDHIRTRNRLRAARQMEDYEHVFPLPELPEYIRVAKCSYDIGGSAVTVYHYFVHAGSMQTDGSTNREKSLLDQLAQMQRAKAESEARILSLQDALKQLTGQSSSQQLKIEALNQELQKRDEQLEHMLSDVTTHQLRLHNAEQLKQNLAERLSATQRRLEQFEQTIAQLDNQQENIPQGAVEPSKPETDDGTPVSKEYRVIIMGDSEAGKSQLLHRLRYPDRDPRSFSGDVTPGIDIASRCWQIGGERVRVNFWDFGGQEILHSLHRLFLSDNTMYVIVLNTRNDNQDDQAQFWLHYVALYATGAPVILVLNKIDQNPSASLNMPVLNRMFQNTADIKDVLRISARDWSNAQFQQDFTDKLLFWIGEVMDDSCTFSGEELHIRDLVRSQNGDKPLMEMAEFRRLCRDSGLPTASDYKKLASRFHRAGMFVYFQTRNNMILNPEWVTNAIYTILDQGGSHAANGILDCETIEDILYEAQGESYRKSHVDFVLKIMDQYGLSFKYRTSEPEQVFIPMLCRREEPEDVITFLQEEDLIQMELLFPYLPAGVLYQLMVDLKTGLDTKNVWLSGAMFHNPEGCTAVVIREKNRLLLSIRCANRVAALKYLGELVARAEGIARGDMYNTAPLERRLGYQIAGETEFFDYDRLELSKAHNLSYAMSKAKPGAVSVLDILDQTDRSEERDRADLLRLTLAGCIDLQKDSTFWNVDENAKNRQLGRTLRQRFFVSDQTQGGLSGSGKGPGELDIEIRNDKDMPIAILEALNTTSIHTANWKAHLDKLMDSYNTSGLRYLILTSYIKCPKEKFTAKFAETLGHWKSLAPSSFENHLQDVDQVLLPDCPELIYVTHAKYVRNHFTTSLYHFMIHISDDVSGSS